MTPATTNPATCTSRRYGRVIQLARAPPARLGHDPHAAPKTSEPPSTWPTSPSAHHLRFHHRAQRANERAPS